MDKIGDKTFEELGVKILKGSSIPLLPDTRQRVLTIPGRNGAWVFGTDLEPRIIELQCAVIGASDKYEFEKIIRAFAGHLCDGKGKPRELRLILSEEPDRYYNVRYAGSIPVERIASFGTFSLPLVAYDPISHLVEDTVEPFTWDSAITFDNSLRFEDDFTFNVTAPLEFEVNNFGTMDAAPKIEVVGSFTTFSISDGDQTLTYNEAVASKTLIIDADKMTVTLDGVNKLSKITGDFLSLPVGINTITITGTGLNCSVSFYLRPRFL